MNISTLENTSISDILACFNLSFSDYLIPLQLSEEQLKSKLIADNTNLSKSIGVFKDKELIGLVLHGVKEKNNKKIA